MKNNPMLAGFDLCRHKATSQTTNSQLQQVEKLDKAIRRNLGGVGYGR